LRAAKETVFNVGEITRDLRHQRLSGCGVMPAMWTDREGMSMKNRM